MLRYFKNNLYIPIHIHTHIHLYMNHILIFAKLLTIKKTQKIVTVWCDIISEEVLLF